MSLSSGQAFVRRVARIMRASDAEAQQQAGVQFVLATAQRNPYKKFAARIAKRDHRGKTQNISVVIGPSKFRPHPKGGKR